MVAGEIESAEVGQLAETGNFGDLIVGEVELFEVHAVDVLNDGDFV